jgi:hypothetical protein
MPNAQVTFNPKPFMAWMKTREQFHRQRMIELMRAELLEIAKDVIESGPKYTGASSGESTGRPLPKNHPALGKIIGNFLTGGTSGWQEREESISANVMAFILSNPMWDHYLKFVEYGLAPTPNNVSLDAHFILMAFQRHLERMRSKR